MPKLQSHSPKTVITWLWKPPGLQPLLILPGMSRTKFKTSISSFLTKSLYFRRELMILQTIIQEEIDSSQELANYEEARTIEPYSMRTYWFAQWRGKDNWNLSSLFQAFEFVEHFVNQTFFPSVELEFVNSFRDVSTFFLDKLNSIFYPKQLSLVSRTTLYLTDLW